VNAATAFADVLVDELIRHGMRHAVISPGSRSAPVALALAGAEAEGRIELRVHFDERSAGFLAMGMAKVSGRPTAVLTTSGTATANLLPSVVEASHSCIPLIVLTADRPPELRGVGANQTIDQAHLYGVFVRHYVEIGVPEDRGRQHGEWRATISRAAIQSLGQAGLPAGPVHVNIPLRPPLVPDGQAQWHEPLDGRAGGQPWTVAPTTHASAEVADFDDRTLVIVGDAPLGTGQRAVRLAEENGWPIISEPSGNASRGPNAVSAGGWLLDHDEFWQTAKPADILVVGRPTLSRAITRALGDEGVRVSVVTQDRSWADAASNVHRVYHRLPEIERSHTAGDWLARWRTAESASRRAIDAVLDATPRSEQAVVRDMRAAMPPDVLLIAGSSLPIRHLFLCSAADEGVTTIANRGAAGIDGTVSTSVGAAAAWQSSGGGKAVALLGDLTFAHDSNGLAVAQSERPQLTIVVLNNDGGGIFELLEPAEAVARPTFERVFAAASGVDIAALAGAHHVPHVRSAHGKEVAAAALDPRTDLQVVEVRCERLETARVHGELQNAVSFALKGAIDGA
jgi:2-succinyl-5-enolpyruvyl-6-hydroxy-3-cyclohexene-1-carboxylate synthase